MKKEGVFLFCRLPVRELGPTTVLSGGTLAGLRNCPAECTQLLELFFLAGKCRFTLPEAAPASRSVGSSYFAEGRHCAFQNSSMARAAQYIARSYLPDSERRFTPCRALTLFSCTCDTGSDCSLIQVVEEVVPLTCFPSCWRWGYVRVRWQALIARSVTANRDSQENEREIKGTSVC